jgi:chemotaxis protein methyltransferase CheR
MAAASHTAPQAEFYFTHEHFEFLREYIREHSGIALSDAKRQLVYTRLVRRLRSLKLTGFDEYCDLIHRGDHKELVELVNAITTNLTGFFREPHHFDYLARVVLPDLMGRDPCNRRLRLWSAGCSTGEEPYSMAMVARESVPQGAGWDLKILATDIDSNVLAKAQAGTYPDERTDGISAERLRRWFRRGARSNKGLVKVDAEAASLVTFKKLNLLDAWPMAGPFDVIFCRNVVIYFDKPTQKALFDRMADILVDRGYLFIGHSESLFKVSERFKLIDRNTYQKEA